MKLAQLFDSLPEEDEIYDLLIVTFGDEPRAINIVNKFQINSKLKIAVRCGTNEQACDENKQYFYRKGFTEVSAVNIIENLLLFLQKFEAKKLRVLFDITCCDRSVMASVFLVLHNASCLDSLHLQVCYSLALFTKPQLTTTPNEAIQPVHPGFAGWPSEQSYPTSLITGLGYEPEKAEGASEYLDPTEQWGFVPISPVTEFLVELESNNRSLISRLGQEKRLVHYEVASPSRTFGQLELVIADLLRRSNPILLPFGPKIFFALCLIQSLRHAEIGVWHVTSEPMPSGAYHVASGIEIGFTSIFSGEDDYIDDFCGSDDGPA